jgi:uncharacterized protein (TIRG00374 family)
MTTGRSFFFMIFGLVAFLLYLYFFVGFDDILLVIEHVSLTQYFVYYSLAVVTLLLVMLLWVVSWKTLLNSLKIKISLKNAFRYYWVGYFIDLVVPCQGLCGEAARLYLMRKETKNDYGAIAACGVANRIAFYTVVTCGLSAGLVYLLSSATMPPVVLYILLVAWIGSVIHVGILLYLALSHQAVRKLASFIFRVLKFLRVKRYSSETTVEKTFQSLSLFHKGSRFFRENPRHLLLPFAFQILAYLLNIGVYALVLSTLGAEFLFIDFFLVVYFLTGAIQDASAVFSVGALEIVLTNVFVDYGFGSALSGVAVAMLRSVTFWFPVVMGYIIIQTIGAKNILNLRDRNSAEAKPKSRECETTSFKSPNELPQA